MLYPNAPADGSMLQEIASLDHARLVITGRGWIPITSEPMDLQACR